jgi:hypothetical protein
MSYEIIVNPPEQYVIEYSNQRGPQGPAGADGDDATATTDASLLVSGTLSDARLSANVLLAGASYGQLATIPSGTLLCNALGVDAVAQASSSSVVRSLLGLATSSNVTFAGLTLSGLQSFTGTSTVGLRLKSLTSAEYNLLTPANGDLFVDSTTDRIDARLARGTVELIDSAGGQTINGALTVGGTLLSTGQVRGASVWFGGVSQANVKLYGTATGQLFIYNSAETAGVMINVTGNSAAFRNLANNADAPITCSNLTASGTVTATGTGTHTFGTTNTVTMAAGLLTASSSFTLFQSSSSNRLAIINASGVVVKNNSYIGWGSSSVDGGGTPVCYFDQSAGTISARTGAGALTPFGCSNLTASGTLQVGGGTVVASILSATATLDFGSIGSNDTETLTITVTGAVAGDSVFLGCPAGLDAGLIFCASVTAANTVTVRMHNSSGGSTDPASGTFRATVIRF